MKPHIASALNLLRLVRQSTDAIGVAVSFGKDSLVTLDLCSRVFSRIEAYYLYRVRDLGIVSGWSKMVRDRWGVRVRMYPHFDLVRCYKHAVLQPHWKVGKVPNIGLSDIESHFARAANIEWFAMGWRRNDSFSRALIMKRCSGFDPDNHRVFPLRSFKRTDVIEYLQSERIPIPPTFGRKEQAGLDFHPEALRALRDHFPDDYAAWLKDFPFAGMQLLEREVQQACANNDSHA